MLEAKIVCILSNHILDTKLIEREICRYMHYVEAVNLNIVYSTSEFVCVRIAIRNGRKAQTGATTITTSTILKKSKSAAYITIESEPFCVMHWWSILLKWYEYTFWLHCNFCNRQSSYVFIYEGLQVFIHNTKNNGITVNATHVVVGCSTRTRIIVYSEWPPKPSYEK